MTKRPAICQQCGSTIISECVTGRAKKFCNRECRNASKRITRPRLPSAARGTGKAIAFLRANVAYNGNDCLIWPWHVRANSGYAQFGYNGGFYYAHRFMCELAHGAAPSSSHECAHDCGNGQAGCVNPRHLAWKTRSENQLDRRRHGTHVTSIYGKKGKLTPPQKAYICAMRGKMTQVELAKMFGVHFQTVSRVQLEEIKSLKVG